MIRRQLSDIRLLPIVVAAVSTWSCDPSPPPSSIVARVGDGVLLDRDLIAALQDFPAMLDSADARKQLIDQWIDSELLYQEALRRNIADMDSVKLRLSQSERAILVDALVSQLMTENVIDITAEDISNYYVRHKEQLALREPFAKVHYLMASDADSLRIAREIMLQTEHTDSVFASVAMRFSAIPSTSLSHASNYLPEWGIFANQPLLANVLAELRPGQTAPIVEENGQFHYVHLAGRAPTRSIPEIAWVEDIIRRQITINRRRQLFQQELQQLRMNAIAGNELTIN